MIVNIEKKKLLLVYSHVILDNRDFFISIDINKTQVAIIIKIIYFRLSADVSVIITYWPIQLVAGNIVVEIIYFRALTLYNT